MAKQIKRQDLAEEDLFRGIRDSAEATLKTINELNSSLKTSASVLRKEISESNEQSAKGLEQLTKATNEAKAAKEAALKLDQEKIKVEQQLLKAEQELEKLQQQKLKTEREAIKNAQILEKEAAKAAKASQDEANVYKQKSKQLNDLRNEYKNLAAQNKQNTAEAKALLTQVTALDQELKSIDATVGQHQRNVGNYSSALADLDKKMASGNLTIREQSKLMREYQAIALQAGTQTPVGQEAIKRAAQLKDTLTDVSVRTKILSSDTLKLDTALAGLNFGTSIFQGMQGAMALAGVESEELMKTMVKLQAVQAVSNSINQITTMLNKDQLLGIQLRIGLEKIKTYLIGQDTKATIANTAATTAQAGATTVATGATRTLGIAMRALPLLAVVAGVAALVGWLYKSGKANEETAKAIKKRADEEKRANEESKKAREYVSKESSAFVGLIMQLKSTNAQSSERKKLIDSINKQYGTTLKNISDEVAFQQQLNQAVVEFIEFKKAQFQLQKNEEAINRNLELQLKLKKQIKDEDKDLLRLDLAARSAQQRMIGQDVDVNNIPEVIAFEKKKQALQDLKDELAAAEKRLEGYGAANLNLQKMVEGKYVPTQVKHNKEHDNTKEKLKALQAALRKTTTAYDELMKVTRISLNPDEVEKALNLEKERVVLAAEIAVIEAEITLEKAKQSGDADTIKKAEKDVLELKKAQINAQRDLDLSRTDNVNEREKIIKKAELDTLKLTETVNESNKSMEETVNALAQAQQKAHDRRMKQIDREMQAAEKQADYLKGLAESGNINARESLAEQQRLIVEANKARERELRRQARIELAISAYNAYQKNAEDKSVKNPLAKTITDITLLSQFIQNLPAFFDGTEDTGANGRGVDGRGGFHAILHPNERVMTKEQNAMTGGLSNVELAKIAQEYNTGELIRKGEGAMQVGVAWQTAAILKELNELKAVIKNKPETNIELGEIVGGAMEIVKTTKKGNDIIYNRYRVR